MIDPFNRGPSARLGRRRRLNLAAYAASQVCILLLWAVGVLRWPDGKALLVMGAIVVIGSMHEFDRLGRALLLACFGMLFGLICAELFLRICFPLATYYRPHEALAEPWPDLPIIARYQPDKRIEMRTYGDLANMSGVRSGKVFRRIEFVTDENGYRNFDVPETGGADSLLVLGDSYGVGTGTTQEAIWPALLGNRTDMQVYNLSMPGSLWYHYFSLRRYLQEVGANKGGQVLLTLFEGNDVDEWYFNPSLDLPQMPWESGVGRWGVKYQNFRNQSPVKRMMDLVRYPYDTSHMVMIRNLPSGSPVFFFKPYVGNIRRTQDDLRSHPNFGLFIKCIRRIDEVCRNAGMELKVALFPSKPRVYRWALDFKEPFSLPPKTGALSVKVRALCRELNVPYVDLLDPLYQTARDVYFKSGEVIWWRDDSHLNPIGHRAVAQHLASFISSNGLESRKPESTKASRAL